MACEKECRDGRRYRTSNGLYQILWNDTRPAWHRGHEADGVGARFDRRPCLLDAADATDFDSYADHRRSYSWITGLSSARRGKVCARKTARAGAPSWPPTFIGSTKRS